VLRSTRWAADDGTVAVDVVVVDEQPLIDGRGQRAKLLSTLGVQSLRVRRLMTAPFAPDAWTE
jgi:hypothetical protein